MCVLRPRTGVRGGVLGVDAELFLAWVPDLSSSMSLVSVESGFVAPGLSTFGFLWAGDRFGGPTRRALRTASGEQDSESDITIALSS